MKELIAEHGAKKITELILEQLGPGIAAAFSKMNFDSESVVRYMPLSEEIKNARKSKSITIKEASKTLKIPQYKLNAIEEGSISQIEPEAFNDYTSFLGITSYVDSWCIENKELAEKIKNKENPTKKSTRSRKRAG